MGLRYELFTGYFSMLSWQDLVHHSIVCGDPNIQQEVATPPVDVDCMDENKFCSNPPESKLK